MTYDDGQVAETGYQSGTPVQRVVRDAANAHTWTSYTDSFDAGGTLTGRLWDYDDGRQGEVTFTAGVRSALVMTDAANAHSWASYTDSFDAAGALTHRVMTYDDGRVVETLFANSLAGTLTAADLAGSSVQALTTEEPDNGVDAVAPAPLGSAIGMETSAGPGWNDTFFGNAGIDTIVFARGDGQDLYIGSAATDQRGQDVIRFEGIDEGDLWFARSGSNLVVSILETADSITMQNWFSGSSLGAYTAGFEADGRFLSYEKVAALLDAMDDFVPAAVDPEAMPAPVLAAIEAAWEQQA